MWEIYFCTIPLKNETPGETYFEYDFIYLAGSKIFARTARPTIPVNFGTLKNRS
jgi:hypothetical protein